MLSIFHLRIFYSISYDKIVRINGRRSDDSSQVFIVHEDLISKHSSYIREICSERESAAGITEVNIFPSEAYPIRHYIDWLYAGRKDLVNVIENERYYTLPMRKSKQARIPARMWLLGDKWDDQDLKNLVMDALCDIEFSPTETLPASSIRFILDTTSTKSRLRSWLMEHITSITPVRVYALKSSLSKDELFELFQSANKLILKGGNAIQSSRVSKSADKCRFHEHGEGQEKCV